MLSAVLDAGVLVSAAITPRGVSGKLIECAIEDAYRMMLCPTLIGELEDVLLRPKFRPYLSEARARQFVAAIVELGQMHPDPTVRVGTTRDPDDDYLLALSQEIGVDYLISGDTHLVELTDVNPPILTPRKFLALIEGSDSL